MSKILLQAVLILLVLAAPPALAWEGTVVSVHDGDTLKVKRTDTGEIVRIRLYGVDAPEAPVKGKWGAQPYCKKSRDALRALSPDGSRVSIMDMGYDKYTRTVGGVITLPDGKIVQEELLKAGLVWVYPKYCPDCRQWKALEEEAREDRLGLWRSNNPVPPWEWRKKGQ